MAKMSFLLTKRGTKLLTGGWWGLARKINYTGQYFIPLNLHRHSSYLLSSFWPYSSLPTHFLDNLQVVLKMSFDYSSYFTTTFRSHSLPLCLSHLTSSLSILSNLKNIPFHTLLLCFPSIFPYLVSSHLLFFLNALLSLTLPTLHLYILMFVPAKAIGWWLSVGACCAASSLQCRISKPHTSSYF